MATTLSGRLTKSLSKREADLQSMTSFDATITQPLQGSGRVGWAGSPQVDNDTYHRMLDEYRTAKAKQKDDELKIKQLAAQLARTEEAAKRALIRSDTTAKGSTAQQLLDAQREVQTLRAENADLTSKLSREKKRCSELKLAADQWRKKAEGALKEQRTLVKKLGEAERASGGGATMRTALKKAAAEEEFWSEEAGRRFAEQQEELVNLRERAAELEQQLASGASADTVQKYEAKIKELQHLVKFYEKRLAGLAGNNSSSGSGGANPLPGSTPAHGSGSNQAHGADGKAGNSAWGVWVVEEVVEGGASYLWDKAAGRLYSDSAPGHWPRPVGIKEGSAPAKLGVRGRCEGHWRALADTLAHHPGRLGEAFLKLSPGGAPLQVAQLGALASLLLPGAAAEELVELVAVVTGGAASGAWGQGEVAAALQEALRARELVRGGSDAAVLEVLAPLRRAVRGDLRAAAAGLADADGDADGALNALEVLHWMRGLVPDASAALGRQLLALLQDWDTTSSGRWTQSDLAAALQLAQLIRAPPGGSAAAAAAAAASRPGSPMLGSLADAGEASFEGGGGAGPRSLGRMMSRVRGVGGPGSSSQNGSGGGGGGSLQEQYLRERVAALESELAGVRAGSKGVDAASVAGLRRELAQYQARVQELEADFMSLDVMAHTDLSDYDAEMRKAWYTAAAFKKRYMEHKLELDAVKAAAERCQGQLDETHKALQAEAARRFALEDGAARWKAEAGRVKDLAAQLTAERTERLKLEKEYLELQGKAFAAPGSALAEVRGLREELLRVRRDKALGEAKEADLRRELAGLKRQMEGVTPESFRTMQSALGEAERKLVNCQLELRAALDKLDVYRRTEGVSSGGTVNSSTSGSTYTLGHLVGGEGAGGGAAVDQGKSAEELRAELRQLREVLQLETADAAKLRQLLDTEASIALAAKAALEEAQRAAAAAAARAAQELSALRRELDHKEERIRKLELQLKGAYGGLNKALRASTNTAGALEASALLAVSGAAGAGGHVSLAGPGGAKGEGRGAAGDSVDTLLATLAPHENVIEFYVTDANLAESQLGGAEVTTFLTWDFYLHDSQATPLVTGPAPAYNTAVQYIVDGDTFLVEYLATKTLTLDLCLARGWDFEIAGRALLPLKVLLEDLEVGAALGHNKAFHHADIKGPAGQLLGRVRYGYRVLKPLDSLVKQYKEGAKAAAAAAAAAPQQNRAEAGVGGLQAAARLAAVMAAGGGVGGTDGGEEVLRAAVAQAEADPSMASQLRITIHRCTGLPLPADPLLAASAAPYVHYTAPGHPVAHDTSRGSGAAPLYRDVADWALVRSAGVDAVLRVWALQVAVFDDAAALEDPQAGLLGVASVPCAALADNLPVEGSFLLLAPGSGAAVGAVQLSMSWASGWAPQVPHRPLPGDPLMAQATTYQQQAAAAAAAGAAAPGVMGPTARAGSSTPSGLKSSRAPSPAQAGPQQPQVQPQQQQQLAARGMEVPQRMLLSNPPGPAAVGPAAAGVSRPRYGQQLDASFDGPPAAAAAAAASGGGSGQGVLIPVPPSMDCWSDFDYRAYFRVDGLRLSAAGLAEARLQHLLVAHMLLEAYTDAAEQCTVALPKRDGFIDFGYAVAYQLLDPATGAPTEAGRALGTALAAAEASGSGLGLPVLLASSPSAVVRDFSTVECVGTCEIPLDALWAGAMGDVLSRDYLVNPSEQQQPGADESVGVVRLTVVACRAFTALKEALRREGAI